MQETVASIRLDGEAVRCVRRAEDRMTQAYRPAREIIELLLDARDNPGQHVDHDPGSGLPL